MVDRPVGELEWKRGFWQQPTWRRPPIALGETNEILKKHHMQMARFRGILPPKRTLGFDELVARDEARLQRAKDRQKRKRKATSLIDRDSDVEI